MSKIASIANNSSTSANRRRGALLATPSKSRRAPVQVYTSTKLNLALAKHGENWE